MAASVSASYIRISLLTNECDFCFWDKTNLGDVFVGGEPEDSDKVVENPAHEGNETESSHGLTMIGSRSAM